MLKYLVSAPYPHIDALTSKAVKYLRKATVEDGIPENAVSFTMDAKMFPHECENTSEDLEDQVVITKEYTTVFSVSFYIAEDKYSAPYPSYQPMWIVCFGDQMAYAVIGDHQAFTTDLRNEDVASAERAKAVYGTEAVRYLEDKN